MSDYVTKMRAKIKADTRRILIWTAIAVPPLLGVGVAIDCFHPLPFFQQPLQIVFMPGSIVVSPTPTPATEVR